MNHSGGDECQYKDLRSAAEARDFSHTINSCFSSFPKEEKPSGILKELVPNIWRESYGCKEYTVLDRVAPSSSSYKEGSLFQCFKCGQQTAINSLGLVSAANNWLCQGYIFLGDYPKTDCSKRVNQHHAGPPVKILMDHMCCKGLGGLGQDLLGS